MKKNRIATVVVLLILIAGLSLLLYPTVSNYLQTLSHRRVIDEYLSNVQEIDDTSYGEMYEEALAYNADLAKESFSLMHLREENVQRYESVLNVTGTGMMGYIQIPSIDVSLPIYHGTSDEVMRVGVGHMEGSSLPVGGETAHILLSGHRGLPSAMLFTRLDELQNGDTFTLRVLNEAHTYEIDKIEVVEPSEVDKLQMETGRDYCTLITCTPYGVNSHRLLVRGHRVDVPEEELPDQPKAPEEDLQIWIPIAVAIFLIIIFVSILLRRKRKKSDNTEEENKNET
ncbi:MAG: class C sortase [Eubacterium sp.]|nr:class C sortase [Eubacterium sp.]